MPAPAQDAAGLTGLPADPMRAGAPGKRSPAGAGPRRTRPIYRVFVSSTWLDLQPERRALMEALNRMEEMRFVGMEFFGNRPDDTHDASIDQVNLCEVLIGIIGFRYGSGITEAEYRRARELGLPCFVYFKRDRDARPEFADGDPALAAKLSAFKQDLLRGHTVKEFTSPEELAANATADLHNWVAAQWVSIEREAGPESRAPVAPLEADRTNILRLLERIQQDWIEGVLDGSLHHRAWLELGLDWREEAVEHPWDRIVVTANRPIQTLRAEDSITRVFDAAQNTLLVLGEPGAGKTTTLLELARDLIARVRVSPVAPAPVVLALSTWTGTQRDLSAWLVTELGLRYQVPKRLARTWIEEGRLVLLLDGLDEVPEDRRAACVEAINAFEQAHHPPGLAVTCRVAEYDALAVKLRLRAAICLQPLTAEQVERYLAAAGGALEPLRVALCHDAGLRELARTPLMLSVMTMAWREGPGIDAGPSGESQECRRRRIFEAYVQNATHRRGKAAGAYTPEQTVGWLSWLAGRMKAHGHTLFAVEQLQPGWLDGTWQQAEYFLATRLLGTIGLVIPCFFWDRLTLPMAAALAALSIGLGLVMGGIDLGFARHPLKHGNAASRRFWILLAACFLVGGVWLALQLTVGPGKKSGASEVPGMIYLLMAAFAFCVPLDVGHVDIKPADTLHWSWRLALQRFLAGVVGVNVVVCLVFAAVMTPLLLKSGWRTGLQDSGLDRFFVGGVIAGAIAGAVVWLRLRPKAGVFTAAAALTFLSLGAQAGSLLGADPAGASAALVFGLLPTAFVGVCGGFVSSMVDPTRARRAGLWFWLRVPVLAFGVVGLAAMTPLGVAIYNDWAVITPTRLLRGLLAYLATAVTVGLVAFLRFGGFNGLQHFYLRWLLVRRGHLPPATEAFFNHAASLALLQKVGTGYRFIHALLLDHLADRAPQNLRRSK